jgi:hypothetical protein
MNMNRINGSIFQEDSDKANHSEYRVNDNRRCDGVEDMNIVISKLTSKWQSSNAYYRIKVTDVNDASSSEGHMSVHIQFLNEMQMRVSIIDKTGHDKSKVEQQLELWVKWSS